MAELSSQFAAISPGMSVETATDGLVSTMKAFNVATDDVEHDIMDRINRLGLHKAQTYGNIGSYLLIA